MARLLWQHREDIGPSRRFLATTTYMSSTAKTHLWGGAEGSQRFGDTWEWDGSGWVQVADTGPTPFLAVGLAFDSVRNVTVLFTSDENLTAFETWEWNGDGWTQVEDTGSQAANGAFAMVYDRARQVTILEGGAVGSGLSQQPRVGTWAWVGALGHRLPTWGHRSVVFAASPMTHPGSASSFLATETLRPTPTSAIPGNGTGTPGNRSRIWDRWVVGAMHGEDTRRPFWWCHARVKRCGLPIRHM